MTFTIPNNFIHILKLHQAQGFQAILEYLSSTIQGAILADDMGLGKTIQTLAVISYYIQNNLLEKGEQILIIVPKSLVENWLQEFKKFAPNISVTTDRYNKDSQVVLVTYDTVLRHYHENFSRDNYFLLILDEAQKIKNPNAKITRTIKSLQACRRLALTGTPFENNIFDLISLLTFLKYNLVFGDNKQLIIPLLRRNNSLLKINTIYHDVICTLTDEQKKLYKEQVRAVTMKDPFTATYKDFVRRRYATYANEDNYSYLPNTSIISKHTGVYKYEDVNKFNHSTVYMKREFITARLILNHPSLGKKENEEPISINQSGKMIRLMSILEFIPAEEKVILFTNSRSTITLLNKLLKEANVNVAIFHGGHSQKQRKEIVKNFQDPLSKTKILILSLKAGGLGLNLTAANHVIMFDIWWNPAVEKQALSRIIRIGQEKEVHVYRFCTKKTIEPSMVKVNKKKNRMFDTLFNISSKLNTFKLSTNKAQKKLSLQYKLVQKK